MKGKVFGIGLSRTGTTSLHTILDTLGYKSMHYVDALLSDPDSTIVDEYDALVDGPLPLLYQQLDAKYPGSKFILTTRSKEAWLDSMQWFFEQGKYVWCWNALDRDYNRRLYGTNRFDRAMLEKRYDTYQEQVLRYFRNRPGDLLVVPIDQGIPVDDICDFLQRPRVAVVFPHANKRRNPSLMARVKYHLKEDVAVPMMRRLMGYHP